jgi:flagellin-like protein
MVTRRLGNVRADDSGVSPVIGVILMVAITVALAAAVYVWSSAFSTGQDAPENAQLQLASFDTGAGLDQWIRLTLVEVVTPDQRVISSTGDPDFELCESPRAIAGDQPGDTTPEAAVVDVDCDESALAVTWDIGESLYIPCYEPGGRHHVTVTIRGTTILDRSSTCDGAPVPVA